MVNEMSIEGVEAPVKRSSRPWRRVVALTGDESGRQRLAGAISRRLFFRLHRAQGGNVTILFMFFAYVFYAAGALVYNTGHAIEARNHTQMAADTAAYSAAMWQARTINQIVGTNMIILRMTTGLSVAWANLLGPIFNLVRGFGGAWMGACPPTCPFCLPPFQCCFYWEIFCTIAWLLQYIGDFITMITNFPGDISDLFAYQQAMIAACPTMIEADRALIESYYGVTLRLTRPDTAGGGGTGQGGNWGAGQIDPPLQQATGAIGFGPMTMPLALRAAVVNERGTRNGADVQCTSGCANGPQNWIAGQVIGLIIAQAIVNNRFHILTSSGALLESGPTSNSDWSPFTVVATAIEDNASEGFLMAEGLFDDPISPNDSVIAYAQGEVFNSFSERLSFGGGGGVASVLNALGGILHFRQWSPLGMNWEPRLTRGSSSSGGAPGWQFRQALQNDTQLANLFANYQITAQGVGGGQDVIRH